MKLVNTFCIFDSILPRVIVLVGSIILDKVAIEEVVTANNVLAENSRVFVDDQEVPLFFSGGKKKHGKKTYPVVIHYFLHD